MMDMIVNLEKNPNFALEQKGVANNNVPKVITSKPVTTVNCGTVSLL